MTEVLPPDRWARVMELFEAASAQPPEHRSAFLDVSCGGDAELRREVASLLVWDTPNNPALDRGVEQALAEAASLVVPQALPIERIGPYRLLSEIGSGGMGTVYLAERDGDFSQRVAIKVVRGLLDAEGLRRFKVERQILASLEHPSIARLLDGGTTPEGLPYLVMELVDGEPIDRYCDTHALAVAQRVALFGRVCDAVSYAHRRLVVHRDLKPSNILVTADGTPKLLDFGIAKLLDDERAEAALVTTPSMRVLTPEYASPEQIRGETITTAADVYSLGVLLFELLTGRRPHVFDSRRPDAIGDAVLAQDAPRPSTVVAPGLGRRRELAGDLDTIVLAALQKEPARRYASVDALAEDLRRYLASEPINARPATWRYRAGRYVRRHRAGAAAAALFVVTVIAFGAALAFSAASANRERRNAERVTSMLIQMFSGSDPRTVRGNSVTARELLDQGAERIRRDLRDEPDMQARLLDALGSVYAGLGLTDSAQTVFRDSMAARQSGGLADSQPAARTMWRLADTLRSRGDFTAAEPLARAAYEMTTRIVGPVNPQTGETLNTLAMVRLGQGATADAEGMFLQATQIFRDTLGPEHPMVALGLQNTARSRLARGDRAGAERLLREALVIQRRIFGVVTAESLAMLARIATADGRLDEAEALLRESLAAARMAFGKAAQPGLQSAILALADALEARGKTAEADVLFREAVALNPNALNEKRVVQPPPR